MSKYWKNVTFWTKIKLMLSACGAGGEITLIIKEANLEWHIITIVATVLSLFLTQFIEDKNNNGVVDALESKKESREGSKQL